MNKIKRFILITTIFTVIVASLAAPIFAWFCMKNEILFYSPLSSPEAIYFGAGHTELRGINDVEEDTFEDIRYLYFEGVDLTDGNFAPNNYSDHVFCVFGRGVSGYKLQVAFTTNNNFRYQIYEVTETSNSNAENIVVSHTTHESTPRTFYYCLNDEENALVEGSFLNQVNDEMLAENNDTYYTSTYGEYSNSKVDKHAVPLYWQTNNAIRANSNGSFIHYYILRVIEDDEKNVNDKETDIVCITAISSSINS